MIIAAISSVEALHNKIQANLTQNLKGSFMWGGSYTHDIYQEIETGLAHLKFRGELDPIDNLQLKIYLHYYFRISIAGLNTDH